MEDSHQCCQTVDKVRFQFSYRGKLQSFAEIRGPGRGQVPTGMQVTSWHTVWQAKQHWVDDKERTSWRPSPGSSVRYQQSWSGGKVQTQIDNFGQGSSFELRADFINSSRMRMAFTHSAWKIVLTLRECKHMFMKITLAVMGKAIYKRARPESGGWWATRSLLLIKEAQDLFTWNRTPSPSMSTPRLRLLSPLLCLRAAVACKGGWKWKQEERWDSKVTHIGWVIKFGGKGLIILPVALMFCL